ncbi:FecR domain-containing protein [Burkholderiaceae bacterium DAT-1]|nr:FecR domain-containing protein [Burkholderiaceae bacterium DAT-1]
MKTRLSPSRFTVLFATVVLGVTISSVSAHAEDDPPTRIARLRMISGNASFAPAGTDDWEWAYVNRPLIAGDRLWIDTGGRASLQLGATTLFTGSRTNLVLKTLDESHQRYSMVQGTLELKVRPGEDDDIEVDTPNLQLTIREPGRYRIDVNPQDHTSSVTVFDGSATASGLDGSRQEMWQRQQVRFGGTNLSVGFSGYPASNDGFQEWVDSTIAADQRQLTTVERYMPTGVVGFEDLAGQGSWEQDAEFGSVWVPRVTVSNWAPYRFGRWVWVAPWGWTWCDDAAWGFAPFHYGRWVHVRHHWAWVPGPREVRAVYAPALVAFVGGGITIKSSRPVAWVPLAPREHYRPWFYASEKYVYRMNSQFGEHVVRDGVFRNIGVHGAISAVEGDHFLHGRPVNHGLINVGRERFGDVRVVDPLPRSNERERDHRPWDGRKVPVPEQSSSPWQDMRRIIVNPTPGKPESPDGDRRDERNRGRDPQPPVGSVTGPSPTPPDRKSEPLPNDGRGPWSDMRRVIQPAQLPPQESRGQDIVRPIQEPQRPPAPNQDRRADVPQQERSPWSDMRRVTVPAQRPDEGGGNGAAPRMDPPAMRESHRPDGGSERSQSQDNRDRPSGGFGALRQVLQQSRPEDAPRSQPASQPPAPSRPAFDMPRPQPQAQAPQPQSQPQPQQSRPQRDEGRRDKDKDQERR